MPARKKIAPFRALFILWSAQSILTLGVLLASPSDVERRFFAFYSLPRWGEILFFAFLSALLVAFSLSEEKSARLFEIWTRHRWKVFWLSAGFLLFAGSQATFVLLHALAQNPDSVRFSNYAHHLRPILYSFSLFGIEVILGLFYFNREQLIRVLQKHRAEFQTLFLILTLLGIVAFALSAIQKQILKSQSIYLAGPPAPLLEWQILLAWLIALGALILARRKGNAERSDLLIAFGIWLIASLLWISQPVHPGFSATAPIAPNYEIYPFSDAQLYAQNAQALLIGKGMAGGGEEFPARPLYVLFLAAAHALGKQDYTRVIALQSLLLALFPVALYFLGKEISGRPLGIALAALAILRDITANQVAPFTVGITYSKLFLSELPVALLLAFFTFLSIRWLQTKSDSWWIPLLAGETLGLSTLIRTQSIGALLPLGVILLLSLKRQNRKICFRGFALLILGISLTLAPWLWRNWQRTGGIVIDNPLSQMNVLAARYTGLPGASVIPHLPGENDSAYSKRMLQIALDSLRQHPRQILGTVAAHFYQNEQDNLLVFPLRNALPSWQDIFIPSTEFWKNWNVPNAPAKTFLLLAYSLFFSAGLTAAWKKLRWAGLLPLGINITYNAWTALFFASGSRFVFPVDWVFVLYEMLGALAITRFFLAAIGISTSQNAPSLQKPSRKMQMLYGSLALLLFASGAALPMSEHILPDRYPPQTDAQRWETFSEKLRAASSPYTPQEIFDIAQKQHLQLLVGRAVYPRYFKAGEGFPLTAKPGYAISPEPRLVFFLLGDHPGRVILPLTETPTFFPHASDVFLLAQDGNLNQVWFTLVSSPKKNVLYETFPKRSP